MTGNVYWSLLGILIVSVVPGRIQGHPHRSPGDQVSINREIPSLETVRYNRTQSQQLSPTYRIQESSSRDRESRKVALRSRWQGVSRVHQTLENDGKIVFSSESSDNVRTKMRLRPATECKNTTFCEYPSFYPEELIKQTITTRQDLHFLSTVDTLGSGIPRRTNRTEIDLDGISLCAFEEAVIFPKTGENKAKKWMYIVNDENFPQGVKIERCMTENTPCSLIEGFSGGYKTMCKQKYVYRQLAAVASNGSLGADFFRIPASCCCHVELSENPLVRTKRMSRLRH